jgi:DNA-binding NtrC family response regulator
VIERALIFSRSGKLGVEPFIPVAPAADATPDSRGNREGTRGVPLGLTLDEVERRYIEATLADTGGNVAEAAERLGITRKVLWSRRKKHGLL